MPRLGRLINIEGSVVLVSSEELSDEIDVIREAILLTKYGCLGGRRSWGFGLIEHVEVLSLKPLKYGTGPDKKEVSYIIQTPIPLSSNEKITNSIVRGISDLASSYGLNISKIEVELHGEIIFSRIVYWDEKDGKPYSNLALRGSKIVIRIEGSSHKFLANLLEYFGVTQNNKWFTKCGYGILRTI